MKVFLYYGVVISLPSADVHGVSQYCDIWLAYMTSAFRCIVLHWTTNTGLDLG